MGTFSLKSVLSYDSSETSMDTDTDVLSDIDDSSDISYQISEDNQSLIRVLQHKVDQLEHCVEIKNKDLVILEQKVKLCEKENEILHLKLSMLANAEWVWLCRFIDMSPAKNWLIHTIQDSSLLWVVNDVFSR